MIITALRQTWQAWADLGLSLTNQEWTRITCLDGWSVQNVYAHYCWTPWFVDNALQSEHTPAGSITHSSASELLAEMQAPGGDAQTLADDLHERAISDSEQYSTEFLTEQFSTLGSELLNRLDQAPADTKIAYGERAVLTLEQAVRLVLLEGVVHYLDMTRVLDRPRPGPVAGDPVAQTVGLLAELADPLAFIDSATGRTWASVFPVLG